MLLYILFTIISCVLGESAFLFSEDHGRRAYTIDLETGDLALLTNTIYSNDIEAAEFVYGNDELLVLDAGFDAFAAVRYSIGSIKGRSTIRQQGHFFIESAHFEDGDISASCDGRVWISTNDYDQESQKKISQIYSFDRNNLNVNTWTSYVSDLFCDGLAYSEYDGLLYCVNNLGQLVSFDPASKNTQFIKDLRFYEGDSSLAFGNNGILYHLTDGNLYSINPQQNYEEVDLTNPKLQSIDGKLDALAIQKKCVSSSGNKSNYSYKFPEDKSADNKFLMLEAEQVQVIRPIAHPEEESYAILGGALAVIVGLAIVVMILYRYHRRQSEEESRLLF